MRLPYKLKSVYKKSADMPQEEPKASYKKEKRAHYRAVRHRKRHFDYFLPLTANVSLLYHHFICHTTSLANSVSDFDNKFSVLLESASKISGSAVLNKNKQETRRINAKCRFNNTDYQNKPFWFNNLFRRRSAEPATAFLRADLRSLQK